MRHSHASIHPRADSKMSPEEVAVRTISRMANHQLKHRAAKQRRQHDVIQFSDYLYGDFFPAA